MLAMSSNSPTNKSRPFLVTVNPVPHVLPKPIVKVNVKVNDAAPKRSLNLEDYKKKRGLI